MQLCVVPFLKSEPFAPASFVKRISCVDPTGAIGADSQCAVSLRPQTGGERSSVMNNLRDFVQQHLEKHAKGTQWEEVSGTDARASFAYSGTNTGMVCCIDIREESRKICIGVSNGVKAPPERLQAAYELACRMNIGLAVGAFWVDSDDGEITFAITASLLEMEPTDEWLGNLITTAFHTFDGHFRTVADVFYAGKDPADAVAAEEGPSKEEVEQSVQRLLSTVGEEPGTADGPVIELPEDQDAHTVIDGRIRRQVLRDIIAKVTPGEIEEILQDERRRRRRRTQGDSSEAR